MSSSKFYFLFFIIICYMEIIVVSQCQETLVLYGSYQSDSSSKFYFLFFNIICFEENNCCSPVPRNAGAVRFVPVRRDVFRGVIRTPSRHRGAAVGVLHQQWYRLLRVKAQHQQQVRCRDIIIYVLKHLVFWVIYFTEKHYAFQWIKWLKTKCFKTYLLMQQNLI